MARLLPGCRRLYLRWQLPVFFCLSEYSSFVPRTPLYLSFILTELERCQLLYAQLPVTVAAFDCYVLFLIGGKAATVALVMFTPLSSLCSAFFCYEVHIFWIYNITFKHYSFIFAVIWKYSTDNTANLITETQFNILFINPFISSFSLISRHFFSYQPFAGWWQSRKRQWQS